MRGLGGIFTKIDFEKLDEATLRKLFVGMTRATMKLVMVVASRSAISLPGQLGDTLHALLCAAGHNLRWLFRAMIRLGLKALLLRPLFIALLAALLRANSLLQAHPAAGLSVVVAAGGVE